MYVQDYPEYDVGYGGGQRVVYAGGSGRPGYDTHVIRSPSAYTQPRYAQDPVYVDDVGYGLEGGSYLAEPQYLDATPRSSRFYDGPTSTVSQFSEEAPSRSRTRSRSYTTGDGDLHSYAPRSSHRSAAQRYATSDQTHMDVVDGLVEMRQYQNPPQAVKDLVEGVMILLDQRESPRRKFTWKEGKRFLNTPQRRIQSMLMDYSGSDVDRAAINDHARRAPDCYYPEVMKRISANTQPVSVWFERAAGQCGARPSGPSKKAQNYPTNSLERHMGHARPSGGGKFSHASASSNEKWSNSLRKGFHHETTEYRGGSPRPDYSSNTLTSILAENAHLEGNRGYGHHHSSSRHHTSGHYSHSHPSEEVYDSHNAVYQQDYPTRSYDTHVPGYNGSHSARGAVVRSHSTPRTITPRSHASYAPAHVISAEGYPARTQYVGGGYPQTRLTRDDLGAGPEYSNYNLY